MANTIWKPSAFLEEHLRREPEFIAGLEAIAHVIEGHAKAIAPVGTADEGDQNPGSYRDSIHVAVREGPKGPTVSVVADDFKSVWIEYGTSKMPAFGTLRKAARLSFSKSKGIRSAVGARGGRVRSTRRKK